VIADGFVVGRIFKVNAAPVGQRWMSEDNAGKLAARLGSTIGLARRGSYLLDRADGTVAKAT
jgi:hypothetical protein